MVKSQESRRKHGRIKRRLKIREGICTICPKKAVPGKRMCQKHLDYYKSIYQIHRKWVDEMNKFANNKCKECGLLLSYRNKIGYCFKHKWKDKKIIVKGIHYS